MTAISNKIIVGIQERRCITFAAEKCKILKLTVLIFQILCVKGENLKVNTQFKYLFLFCVPWMTTVLAKVHILSLLNCYYKLFPLIYISFDNEGITIQGSCEERRILATTVIPRDSLEHYECREPAVVYIPFCLKKIGSRCVSIDILQVDSWRVKNVF